VLVTISALLPGSLFAAPNVRAELKGFIRNVGQWPAEVLYAARTHSGIVWITRTGVVHDQFTSEYASGVRTGNVVREIFLEANPSARRNEGHTITHIAFIKGRAASQHVVAPVVDAVSLQDVVPGVDIRYSVEPSGVARTITYSEAYVPGSFTVEVVSSEQQPRGEAFAVTPVTSVVYGTFVGGTEADNIVGVEYLTNGQIIIAGNSPEIEFPNATGGYQTTIKGTSDGFVARLDRKLEKFLSYTFYGGSGSDRITALTADNVNNIYVTGETVSTDLPITSGASGQLAKGGIDAFIAKFDSTLTKLIVSGYHGGNKDD